MPIILLPDNVLPNSATTEATTSGSRKWMDKWKHEIYKFDHLGLVFWVNEKVHPNRANSITKHQAKPYFNQPLDF